MQRHLVWAVPTILATAGLSQSAAQGQASVYTDRNRYFLSIQPPDWQREDYPSEQIRSKVAFHPPQEPGVTISVIAGPAPDPIPTFDEWYRQREQRVAEFGRRFPNARSVLKKSKLGVHSTIVWNTSMPGNEQEVLLLMIWRVQHTVSYNAPGPEALRKHRAAFDKFLGNFVPLEGGRQFSEQELTQARVASKKAMAKSSEAMGDRPAALAFVNEGLGIDPHDPELQQMKHRLMR